MNTKSLDNLQRHAPIARPYVFDRVEVRGRRLTGELVAFSILGACYSEFASGPSLFMLADAAGGMVGAGYYGLGSLRKRVEYFQKELGAL